MIITRDTVDGVGAFLQMQRRMKGMTLMDVYKACGLTVSAANAIELDRVAPRLTSLAALAEALDLVIEIRPREKK